MATDSSGLDSTFEHCPGCGTDTHHEIRLEIRTESQSGHNARFSREPYRIARCVDCGDERTTRMNNA